MPRDDTYLEDILHAARAVRRFLGGVTHAEFVANEEKYEAVNRKFEIIGEAARRLSPEVRARFPEIPWNLAMAMRNVLIHDYDDVNLDIVWKTAQDDLPRLIEQLERHLNSQPPKP